MSDRRNLRSHQKRILPGKRQSACGKPGQSLSSDRRASGEITAMYLYNEWWTRPAFVNSLEDIPARTQVAFFQYKDRYACFVPMIGQAFKTYLIPGTKTEIALEMTAWTGGQRSLEEPLYLLAEAPVLQDAIHRLFPGWRNTRGSE